MTEEVNTVPTLAQVSVGASSEVFPVPTESLGANEILLLTTGEFETIDELQVLEGLDSTIQRIKQLRQSHIDEIQHLISQLKLELARLDREFQMMTRLQVANTAVLAQLTNVGTSTLESILGDAEVGEVIPLLKRKARELADTRLQISDSINQLEGSITSLALDRSKFVRQVEQARENLEQSTGKELLQLVSGYPNSNNQINENRMILAVLQINLIKNLGGKLLTVVNDDGSEQDVVAIYNKEKDSTWLLKVDGSHSDHFIANYIWDRLS